MTKRPTASTTKHRCENPGQPTDIGNGTCDRDQFRREVLRSLPKRCVEDEEGENDDVDSRQRIAEPSEGGHGGCG